MAAFYLLLASFIREQTPFQDNKFLLENSQFWVEICSKVWDVAEVTEFYTFSPDCV